MTDMLDELESLIQERKAHPRKDSYTNQLFQEGRPKIAQKVGEEAAEVIVAALSEGKSAQIAELADLFYHTLVLMTDLGITLDDIRNELKERHQP